MDATVTDPMVGRLLDGRYLVGRRIARGGMSTVYEAVDTRLDRTVALKVMHSALADDAEFVRRFQREARSAARLSHPNVVAVFDQGEDQGAIFLAMENVAGQTLRHVLRNDGRLPPMRALDLLDQILRALAAAHDAGLVHRDVKPENVLLGDDGAVKVADFGLARAVSGSSTATQGLLMGTVSYLAPEQVTHGVADARADVYAAGIVLYEMLVGAKPHDGDTPIQVAYKHVNEDVPAPSEQVRGLPSYLDGLVLRAASRDRDVRPTDARVLLQHVRRARSALAQGVDDPELTEDLTIFRRQVGSESASEPGSDAEQGSEHTLVAPIGAPIPLGDAPLRVPPGYDSGNGSGPFGDDSESGADDETGSHRGATQRRGRRGLVALILVVLLAVLGGIGAWYLGIARYTHVPAVLNAPRAALADRFEAAELRYEIAGQGFSESIARGRVMRSDPAVSARARKDSTVLVWLSKGPERHPVPQLAGKTERQARDLVRSAKLRVGRVERVYRTKVPAGTVLRYSPEAGTQLRRNQPVSLVVSRGPEPVAIPSVVGRSIDQAKATLQPLGLVTSERGEFSDQVPAGQVIRQNPGPGPGHRGDKVALFVSRGPEFVPVPTVRGMGEQDAIATLKNAGFVPEVRQNPLFANLHYVVQQSPAGGEKARVGSTVVVEIV